MDDKYNIKNKPSFNKKQVYTILFIELILCILFFYQLFQIIKIDVFSREIDISHNVLDFFILFLIAFLFISLLFIIKKKQHVAYLLQKQASTLIKEGAKRKIISAKEDPTISALLMLEIMFSLIIALAIFAYIDPEFSIIPWEKLNIYGPITTILNATIFFIILFLFIYVYNIARRYRRANI